METPRKLLVIGIDTGSQSSFSVAMLCAATESGLQILGERTFDSEIKREEPPTLEPVLVAYEAPRKKSFRQDRRELPKFLR